MIVQEANAEKHWCPFARMPWTGDTDSAATVNRRRGMPSATVSPCLGSTCMAWRRAADIDPGRGHGEDGFCGLAGRPLP